jgi:hypothetical protein
MDTETIKKRWHNAWDAKQDELDRIEKSYLWLYEFEKHLKNGEEGNESYRFPEIMGYCLRRYNEYLQVMPEVRTTGSGDSAIGLQAAIDHEKIVSNLESARMEAIADATFFGNGCLQVLPFVWKRRDKSGKEYVQYSGLTAERVDWRHFFPAPGYKKLHDHTGKNACPYAFRRKIYNYGTFLELAKQKGWKTEGTRATTWNDSNVFGDSDWSTAHESVELSTTIEFITVLEYWDIVNDEMRMYATGGLEIYAESKGIPLKHKQLPFHHYRNVYRADSINALGEIEINMPYNLFREKILNLAIDDVMLQVQKAFVVDGDINFNTEEQELEAGAILTVGGLNGGKLQDHVMPLQFGGAVNTSVMQVIQMVENSRISVTSDDTTALYSNPNQLATQTMAKMQSLNKSIDGATKRNVYDTEFYLTNQIVSLLKNELAQPYKDGKETKYHKVKIKGYDVVQDGPDSGVKFKQGYGASGEFSLNSKTSEMFEDEEIEIVPAQKDAELKASQTEKLTMFLQTMFQTIGTLAQADPTLLGQVLGDMNVAELIKVQLKNLGLDNELKNVFPIISRESYQLDEINAEHEQIMAGVLPQIREDENSMEEFAKHQKFADSAFFEKYASKEAKKAMTDHLILTSENVQTQVSIPIADRKKRLAGAEKQNGVGGVQGNAGMVGSQATAGGAGASIPQPQGGMEQGIPGGTTQPSAPVLG